MNKIDLPDSDKNINNIFVKYEKDAQDNRIILVSALAEQFLRKMQKEQFVHYVEGTDAVWIADDDSNSLPSHLQSSPLKPIDEKNKSRLEKVQDMVLFRYGSTGCQDVIQTAVTVANMIPIYPVKSINNFGAIKAISTPTTASVSGKQRRSPNSSMTTEPDDRHHVPVFADCVLVERGTAIRGIARMLFSESELERQQLVVETLGGRQVSDEETVQQEGVNQILAFKFRQDTDN